MKKLLLILVSSIVFLMMLVGCSGTVTPLPPDEEVPAEVLQLIKEYIGHDHVVRWADGIVNVYDGTTKSEWTKDILDETNIAIDGPVIFNLSDDYNNSQIKIIFKDLTGTGMGQATIYFEYSDNEILNVDIEIDPLIGVEQPLYMCLLLNSFGIDLFKSVVGLTQEMKTVLYWLYRLEPGYPLI